MKRFKDLTELEIKDLDEMGLAHYIMVEVAENGIEIVDKPEKPEYAKEIEPDTIIYGVEGNYSFHGSYKIEESAQKVCDTLNSVKGDMAGESRYDGIYHVKPINGYSERANNLKKTVDATNKKIKNKYDEEYQKYEEYREKVEPIEKAVRNKYNEVVEKYYRLDQIKRKYNDTYLPLADNNVEIAKRFLFDAYTVAEEDKEYIFS